MTAPHSAATPKVTPTERFGTDPKPYYLAFAVLAVLELVRRAFLGYVPNDFTAYLAAADVFAQGSHPYQGTALVAERYEGMPYNYLPGTLYLIWPLHFLPTAAAVAIDWAARCVAIVLTARILWRRLLPDSGFHLVLLLVLLHQPFNIDLLFGNVSTYLMLAFAGAVWAADRGTDVAGVAVAFGCGVMMGFKPFWGVSSLFVLLSRRRWLTAAAHAAGGATILLLSLPFLDILPAYAAHVTAMADFYYSVALATFAAWAIPFVGAMWIGAGALLARRNPQHAWLWGCFAMTFWPRLGTYDYVMAFPIVLFLIGRWGWLRGVLVSLVFLGPLPWLLRVAPVEPQLVLEAWTHWLWVWVMAVVVYAMLWAHGARAAGPDATSRARTTERR